MTQTLFFYSNCHLFFHDASKGMMQQMQTTFLVVEIKSRGQSWGGAIRLSPEVTTGMETPAQGHVPTNSPPDLPANRSVPRIKGPSLSNPAFHPEMRSAGREQTGGKRECHTNAAAGDRLLHRKLFKGQQRPAVTPLDRKMDSLVSAA